MPRSSKNEWRIYPPTLARQGRMIPRFDKIIGASAPDSGARIEASAGLTTTYGESILQPWRQGVRILRSSKNPWRISPPTLNPGSKDPQVCQTPMENHSSTLCSIVGGSSDLTKKQWKIDPPTLAPESHDPHVAGRASDISCRRSNESHGKIYFPRSRSSRTKHKRQVFFKRVANCMEKNLCYTHPLLSERSIVVCCVRQCSEYCMLLVAWWLLLVAFTAAAVQ